MVNKMALQCILLSVSIGEIWLCYQISYITFFEKEYLSTWNKIVIYGNILILGILLAISRSVTFFSRSVFIFCVLVTSICMWIIKKKSLVIFGMNLFFFTLVRILDFFFAFVSMEILGRNFTYKIYMSVTLWNGIIFCCSRLIVFCGVLVLIKSTREEMREFVEGFKWLILGTSLFLAFLLLKYQLVMDEMVIVKKYSQGIGSGFTLLTITVLLLFMCLFIIKYQAMKNENEILHIHEKIMDWKYQEMKKNGQLIHDMKNHFIVLKKCVEEGANEKLYSYIDEICERLICSDIKNWTGRYAIDLILSQKKAEAEKKDIVFNLYTTFAPEIAILDSDLVVLFGNLLDNAIEACMKVESKYRRVDVKIGTQNELLFIQIDNSIGEPPIQKGRNLVTTKNEKMRHGYGLKSVENIVKKYDGTFSYYIEEKHFSIVISFYSSESIS